MNEFCMHQGTKDDSQEVEQSFDLEDEDQAKSDSQSLSSVVSPSHDGNSQLSHSDLDVPIAQRKPTRSTTGKLPSKF
jgi:hypothetical protein